MDSNSENLSGGYFKAPSLPDIIYDQEHLRNLLPEFDITFSDDIKKLAETSEICATQIKDLLEVNIKIKSELSESKEHIRLLQFDTAKMKESHKHDIRNQILISFFSAIVGALLAQCFQIDWISLIKVWMP